MHTFINVIMGSILNFYHYMNHKSRQILHNASQLTNKGQHNYVIWLLCLPVLPSFLLLAWLSSSTQRVCWLGVRSCKEFAGRAPRLSSHRECVVADDGKIERRRCGSPRDVRSDPSPTSEERREDGLGSSWCWHGWKLCAFLPEKSLAVPAARLCWVLRLQWTNH